MLQRTESERVRASFGSPAYLPATEDVIQNASLQFALPKIEHRWQTNHHAWKEQDISLHVHTECRQRLLATTEAVTKAAARVATKFLSNDQLVEVIELMQEMASAACSAGGLQHRSHLFRLNDTAHEFASLQMFPWSETHRKQVQFPSTIYI